MVISQNLGGLKDSVHIFHHINREISCMFVKHVFMTDRNIMMGKNIYIVRTILGLMENGIATIKK